MEVIENTSDSSRISRLRVLDPFKTIGKPKQVPRENHQLNTSTLCKRHEPTVGLVVTVYV